MKTFEEYEREARKTTPVVTTTTDAIIMGALGLAGESGEVVELVKKAFFHGHSLEPAKVARELGDVLWYIQHIANEIGMDLETIAQLNVDKLRSRYGETFSEYASRNRKAGDE